MARVINKNFKSQINIKNQIQNDVIFKLKNYPLVTKNHDFFKNVKTPFFKNYRKTLILKMYTVLGFEIVFHS